MVHKIHVTHSQNFGPVKKYSSFLVERCSTFSVYVGLSGFLYD